MMLNFVSSFKEKLYNVSVFARSVCMYVCTVLECVLSCVLNCQIILTAKRTKFINFQSNILLSIRTSEKCYLFTLFLWPQSCCCCGHKLLLWPQSYELKYFVSELTASGKSDIVLNCELWVNQILYDKCIVFISVGGCT